MPFFYHKIWNTCGITNRFSNFFSISLHNAKLSPLARNVLLQFFIISLFQVCCISSLILVSIKQLRYIYHNRKGEVSNYFPLTKQLLIVKVVYKCKRYIYIKYLTIQWTFSNYPTWNIRIQFAFTLPLTSFNQI